MVDYRDLWVRLNRPSPERFQAALRKRGIVSPGLAFLREHLIADESSKQLFRPGPKYDGHIYSAHLDDRWVMDIMQLPEADGYSYALVVQDIFSRYAWAEPIKSPTEAAVGLKHILARSHRRPTELVTDDDVGYKNAEFQSLLRENGIVQTIRAGRNDIATVDSLIRVLKRAIAEHQEDTGQTWTKSLSAVVDGWNESQKGVLYGSAPEDVKGNKSLIFERQWDESHGMRENAEAIHKRAAKLEGKAYRVYLPAKGLKRRATAPLWSRELHEGVAKGAFINGVPTKEVLPVPKDSKPLAPEPVRLDYEKRNSLSRYGARAVAYVQVEGGRASVKAVTKALVELAGSRENLLQAYKLAGVGTRELVRSIVAIYPDMLKIDGGDVVYVGG